MKALTLNAIGRGSDVEDVDIAAPNGRSTKDERAKILRRLNEAASARLGDLTAAMVEEYELS